MTTYNDAMFSNDGKKKKIVRDPIDIFLLFYFLKWDLQHVPPGYGK